MKKIFFIMMVISVMSLAGAKAFAQGCGGGASTDDGVKVFGFLQSQYEYYLTDPSQNSFLSSVLELE